MNEMWPYQSGTIKFYSDEPETLKRLSEWSGCKRSCTYSTSKGKIYAYDFICPAKMRNRLAKLIKGGILSTPDSQNRPVEARTAV